MQPVLSLYEEQWLGWRLLMTLHHSEIFRQPGQGPSYWFLGDLYTFKAIGEETGEAYALCEAIVQPQSGSPPHRHQREDEAFYVQSGEFEFHLDGQTIIATAGTFLHSPKGQQHRSPTSVQPLEPC
jgi:quercetin dioxygenase-like cupin family protein